ncbi:MAG: pacearchaeosortase [Candidatus Nanoarchaeia archaeon]|nr:pacearchaeosortase [Candidatus Nanoarchaeia archaeon]
MRYYKDLILRICLVLVILLIPFNLFYFIFLKPTLLLSGVFWISKGIVIGSDYLVYNNTILSFIPACIATSAYFLLFILVMLTRMKWVKRLKIFISGCLFIFIGNIIRITVLLYYFLNNNINMFENLHFLIWNVLSTVYVFLVWVFLVYRFKVKSIPLIDDIKYLINKIKA